MKTVSSSFLILVLLSSAVIGLLSVSSYSIPVAYAETSDITDILNYVCCLTNIHDPKSSKLC